MNARQIAPAIHMNGSSRESLIKEWEDFHTSLQNTLDNFPYESFHGRNQYVKSEDDQKETGMQAFEMKVRIASVLGISEDIINILNND